jgi:DNA polymerase IV
LFLKNSTGIATMLQKKQKRKRDAVTLVPEEQRIFQGLNFFYLPADDKSPIRRRRITLARNHGANWVKELGVHVHYLIVDNSLTYQQVMAYFKTLPDNITMVNENYPLECMDFGMLVDVKQEKYAVKGSPGYPSAPQIGSQTVEDTLDLEPDQRRTPPQGESQSQPEDVGGEVAMDTASQPPSPSSEKHWSLGYSDALDEMIKIAQRTKHLPLDEDDEEPSSLGGSMQDPDDSDREGSRSPIRAPVKKKRKGNKGPKGSFNQENFSCMRGGTGISTSNPNERTIEVLSEMAGIYDRIKDHWRSVAYNKAIGSLRKETHKISTFEEAFDIQWIGKRLAKKIEEIVLTDGLRRLEYAKLEPRERVLQDFSKQIPGAFYFLVLIFR